MEAFKSILHEAQRIVVLTGAGMSTESGIPDFRSAGGIWTEDASRMEAMSLDYFLSHPRLFLAKIQRIVPDENERQL
nr:Sir2 family NAD-dependent protein deacetylase [Bacillus subtilis]